MSFKSTQNIRTVLADPQAPIRSLLTLRQFSEHYPGFTVRSLRHLIFWAKPRHNRRGSVQANGLATAVVRIGRKLFIDEARFFEWIEQQQKRSVANNGMHQ